MGAWELRSKQDYTLQCSAQYSTEGTVLTGDSRYGPNKVVKPGTEYSYVYLIFIMISISMSLFFRSNVQGSIIEYGGAVVPVQTRLARHRIFIGHRLFALWEHWQYCGSILWPDMLHWLESGKEIFGWSCARKCNLQIFWADTHVSWKYSRNRLWEGWQYREMPTTGRHLLTKNIQQNVCGLNNFVLKLLDISKWNTLFILDVMSYMVKVFTHIRVVLEFYWDTRQCKNL